MAVAAGGVMPEWSLSDIDAGMAQFMVIQLVGLPVVAIFPEIALWLPRLIYGN